MLSLSKIQINSEVKPQLKCWKFDQSVNGWGHQLLNKERVIYQIPVHDLRGRKEIHHLTDGEDFVGADPHITAEPKSNLC